MAEEVKELQNVELGKLRQLQEAKEGVLSQLEILEPDISEGDLDKELKLMEEELR